VRVMDGESGGGGAGMSGMRRVGKRSQDVAA